MALYCLVKLSQRFNEFGRFIRDHFVLKGKLYSWHNVTVLLQNLRLDLKYGALAKMHLTVSAEEASAQFHSHL